MYSVFNIGGTNTRWGLSNTGQDIDVFETWKTPMDFETGVEQMVNLSAKYPADGVVVAIAGTIGKKKDGIVQAPNLPGWVNQPLVKKLEEKLRIKVMIENDAACEGLGEACRGAGRKHENVAYICVGTGIGGARIIKGKIDTRSWGFEPGHQIIDVNGELGYWGEFASGKAMQRVYGLPAGEIKDPEAWENEARLLAVGLHNVTVMWSPEIIILGGSIIKSINLERLKQMMNEMRILPTIPEIESAVLGEKAGLYGALELAVLGR